MIDIEKTLEGFQKSLCKRIDIPGLWARSETAHKWKLTFRLITLREGLSWRLIDLLTQAYKCGQCDMIVGARIIARSAIETVSLLVYMNRRMKSVVENKMSFNDFNDMTSRLLLGAKKYEFMPPPINVMSFIGECNKNYTVIEKIYNDLSETAHPNYDGIHAGYIKLNREEYYADFGIFWEERFGNQHEDAISYCIEIFEEEYNNEWLECFEALEKWLEKNDSKLEREKRKRDGKNI